MYEWLLLFNNICIAILSQTNYFEGYLGTVTVGKNYLVIGMQKYPSVQINVLDIDF